jgi:uncharacterized membrane protein YfcA
LSDLAYSLLVVFSGYVVFGVTGFGSALIIVPLLALRWPLEFIVPLVLMLDLIAALQLGHLNFREIRFAELRLMIPGVLLGTVLGLFLASWGTQPWLLVALGGYVVAAGVNGLRQTEIKAMLPESWALPFGVGIGVIEAVFGTSGPLIVAFLTRRLSDARQLRITIASGIFVVVAITLVGFGAVGRLADPQLWQRLPWLAAVTLLGCFVGHHAVRYLSPQRLKRVICGLLVVSGVMLSVHGLGTT